MSGYGQVVIGPPGSGKTTYCQGMSEFLKALNRNVYIVNLDPANDTIPYDCEIDIGELIGLQEVMETLNLGPNGAMVYCIEFLEANLAWLVEKLRVTMNSAGNVNDSSRDIKNSTPYFLFDLPGQVELFTHHMSLNRILHRMNRDMDLRLTAVHLIDSYHCSDPAKFISVVLLSLSTMLRLELPHVNVLSKMDMIESHGDLHFNLEYYTNPLDLSYLLSATPGSHLEKKKSDSIQESIAACANENEDGSMSNNKKFSVFKDKYHRLNKAICELLEDYQMVSFQPLNIQDKQSLRDLIKIIDKTTGYVELNGTAGDDWSIPYIASVQERYMDG